MSELLTKGLFSESGLHNLPSRWSRCARNRWRWWYGSWRREFFFPWLLIGKWCVLRILRIFITGSATALTIMLLFCSIRNILCNVLQFIEVQFWLFERANGACSMSFHVNFLESPAWPRKSFIVKKSIPIPLECRRVHNLMLVYRLLEITRCS